MKNAVRRNGKRFPKAAVLALLPALVLPNAAFSSEIRSLDIYEAIEITLASNAALRSQRLDVDAANALKIASDAAYTPEVEVSAYVNEQREDQTSDGSSRSDGRGATLSLIQQLYTGGRNEALRRQTMDSIGIAGLSLIDGENRAIGELFARFYNVILQEKRVETALAAIKTSDLHRREVTKMSELGLANRLEVIRAEGQLAANEAALAEAKGLREAATISLFNFMAIAPDARRPIEGTMRVFEPEGNRENSLASAMSMRADRRALELALSHRQNQIEIEKSAMRPKISLGASTGYLSPYRGADKSDSTWRAELSITLPILDRAQTRSALMRQSAGLGQDMIGLEQMDLDIASDVETAWTELETTIERLRSTSRTLDLAVETLRLAELGYAEGVTPQLDLLAAQSSLTESRLLHLNAIYNHMLAVVALTVTEGNIIEWTIGRDL